MKGYLYKKSYITTFTTFPTFPTFVIDKPITLIYIYIYYNMISYISYIYHIYHIFVKQLVLGRQTPCRGKPTTPLCRHKNTIINIVKSLSDKTPTNLRAISVSAYRHKKLSQYCLWIAWSCGKVFDFTHNTHPNTH